MQPSGCWPASATPDPPSETEIMDTTTFNRLEFPAVLEKVAQLAESDAARQSLLETKPWTDLEVLRRHWDGVEEILRVLDSGGDSPIAGFDDCGEPLERLRKPHSILDSTDWQALRQMIQTGRAVRRHIRAHKDIMHVCWKRCELIDPLSDLVGEIDRVFDADGLVRDSASDELRSCRGKIRRLEREIERVFDRILSKSHDDNILQDAFRTERGGRGVLPVRAGARGRLPGIVHDVSNTGETIFVEPMEVVEPTNRLTQEKKRERDEIILILATLTDRAREEIEILDYNREALVQIDLWHARARLAYRHNLHRPQIEPGHPVHLIETHHPLLYFSDPESSVPLDLRLEPENRALIITGPNTGGKTTSLKTIGLTVLMAQSAIPAPIATDSRLPLFDLVLAEVGDDQSVAAGLSTFSAHIRRISWILDNCSGKALVLLDELGKATDPLQAGALGRAIIEALVDRGALTLVTTHLPTLKDWAHDSPDGRNASFRLDPTTHRPLYQVHLDTPGISEAFTIARVEGLPAEIVEAAKGHLPKEELELSELLQTLHANEERLEKSTKQAEQARDSADSEKRRLGVVRAEMESSKVEWRKRLEEEYKDLLDKARGRLEQRISNLPSRQALSQAREQMARDQRAATARLEAIAKT